MWGLPAGCPFSWAALACVPAEPILDPKWIQNGPKIVSPKSDPGPLWVTADVLLARSKAYLGRFDRPYVPNSLRGEPFWDQKRVKSGSKLYFFGCALGPIGVLKRLPLAHFVASLDCLDMICKNVWKGKCIKNEDEAKGPANGRY